MIHHGDLFDVLPTLEEASVDACVTDPPYELKFMGKHWDGSGVAFQAETWVAVLRVLKPGAHLVAFGGTRTFHRMTCAIEDAGFEIRDCLSWLYGQGFPKSLDVSKAIDKAAGAEREIVGHKMRPDGKTILSGRPNGFDGSHAGWDRPWKHNPDQVTRQGMDTAPSTDAAKQWQGWGTALKPSFEPVILARKPLPTDRERATIVASLIRLEAQLWSLLPVSIAVEVFKLSQSEYDAACGSAQWTADERLNTWADLFGRMDTPQSVSVMTTCLSTVTSWSNTLAECSDDTSMSTIATGSSQTIDWRTLKSCLSALTPRIIIQAAISQPGSWWSVVPAARVFHAALMNISATRELSALAPVIAQARISCQDADAPKFNVGWEPIILARKPFRGSVTANVLAHGTGALNVDACRIGIGEADDYGRSASRADGVVNKGSTAGAGPRGLTDRSDYASTAGRWPSNVLLDEEAAAMLDEQSGEREVSGAAKQGHARNPGKSGESYQPTSWNLPNYPTALHNDVGGASRFFYVAKPSREERDYGCDALPLRPSYMVENGSKTAGSANGVRYERTTQNRNIHPTVKPVELMRWLVRLVTPIGGTVLDPFAGSGTTGMACAYELRPFIGIEREAEYVAIAERRIAACVPLFTSEQSA